MAAAHDPGAHYVGAGPASLVGLTLAKEKGWTAPEGATSSGSGAKGAPATPGNTEVTPAHDEAKAPKAEQAAVTDEADDVPGEEKPKAKRTTETKDA